MTPLSFEIPPAGGPPSSPRQTTFGLTEHEMLLAWAEASGVGREAAFLEEVLRIRTEQQKQLLRTVYDNLEAVEPTLSRWKSGEQVVRALWCLAAAWRERPRALDPDSSVRRHGVPGRPTGVSPLDAEFRSGGDDSMLDHQQDALFLLMQCQVPHGSDRPGHLQRIAWLLVSAAKLAIEGHSPTDKLLSDGCRALRIAAYETQGGAWRTELARLDMWTSSYDALSRHLAAFRHHEPAAIAQKSTIRRLARFAAGERNPFPVATSHKPGVLNGLVEHHGERFDIEPAELRPTLRDVVLAHDLEHADADEPAAAFAVTVDPDASPLEQALHVRSARMQLGAAARFVGWHWDQPSPPESAALQRLIDDTLSALDPLDSGFQLIAAFAWLADLAGLTLNDLLIVPVEPVASRWADAEWWLDIAHERLVRRPARRANHKKPSEEQSRHLRPAVKHLMLTLPAKVCTVLARASRQREGARIIGQLWPHADAPAVWFRRWVGQRTDTRRLQPSMLGRMLGQRTFDTTGDSVLARLLPATADSALPASTVYTSYRLSEVMPAWPGASGVPADADHNVAGSLLDLSDDYVLADGFRHLLTTIRDHRQRGEWREFHNAVSLYWDASLRAATGTRPVNELWLRSTDFDWTHHFVFIDDKASPVGRSGRLVPLPIDLCNQFRDLYLRRHLPWILERLAEAAKAPLAEIPMLFVIDDGLSVHPVTNQWRTKAGIEAPLPLNIFRHRIRTELHRKGVSVEIVDAVLGHGDGATLTHGNHSMRAWKTDADMVRPTLTEIHGELRIEAPPVWEACDICLGWPAAPAKFRASSATTGMLSLSQARAARKVIESFLTLTLAGDDGRIAEAEVPPPALRTASLLRRLTELSSEQLDVLSSRLLKRNDGLPDPTGVLRYEYLIRLAERAWLDHGLRVRMRRRYSVRELEDSPFRHAAAGALDLREDWSSALEAIFSAAPTPSRISAAQALALALADLVLASRITHSRLLHSLGDSADPWRIVRLDDRHYLEWSPDADLNSEPSVACMRYPISARAAWLLTRCVRGTTRRQQAWDQADKFLQPLFSEEAPNAGTSARLDRLCTVVDQCNVIELPGTAAGYLAGRVWTASLPWGEWVRIRTGRWTHTAQVLMADANRETSSAARQHGRYGDPNQEDEGDRVDPSALTGYRRVERSHVSPQIRQSRAFQLVRRVRSEIRDLHEVKGLTKRRQDRAKSLARHVREESQYVSSAIQLLCLWAIDMLVRPGRSRKLATSSVLRYFNALAPRFIAVGCDVELDGIDDEQVEAFFSDVIDARQVKQLRDVYLGLRSFHRYAHHVAGLPEVDWSCLGTFEETIFGAPGFVDEETYLRILEHLGSTDPPSGAQPWQLQCLLMLCFRFGLRGGEAVGLLRSDVILDVETPYIVVRRNRNRNLKTSAARRIVPLLFEPTPLESEALARVRNTALSAQGTRDEDLPLFSERGTPQTCIDDRLVRAHLNQAIKAHTGQSGSSLHDLRHSFAMHVWAATQPLGWRLLGCAAPSQSVTLIARKLLGPMDAVPTRRAPWALSTLMGHVHPGTALRNYVHSLDQVIDAVVDPSPNASAGFMAGDAADCIDLSGLADAIRPMSPRPRTSRVPHPADSLTALRYIAAGQSDAEVAVYTDLPLHVVGALRACATAVFERLKTAPRSQLTKHLPNVGGASSLPATARLAHDGLLAFVHANAYERLRAALSNLDASALEALSRIDAIPAEHWRAMVGDRRELSLWSRDHFLLLGMAIRHLSPAQRQLQLQIPLRRGTAPDPLLHLAKETGWLPDEALPLSLEGEHPLCAEYAATTAAPAVRLSESGSRVERRAVVLFSNPATGAALDRLELLVGALCMNCFTNQAMNRA